VQLLDAESIVNAKQIAVRSIFIIALLSAIVFAVAKVKERQNRKTCENNMMGIDSAVSQWGLADNVPKGQFVSMDRIRHTLPPHFLKCPSGGTYTIPPVGDLPSCSIHGRVTWSDK